MASYAAARSPMYPVQARSETGLSRSTPSGIAVRSATCAHRAAYLGSTNAFKTSPVVAWQAARRDVANRFSRLTVRAEEEGTVEIDETPQYNDGLLPEEMQPSNLAPEPEAKPQQNRGRGRREERDPNGADDDGWFSVVVQVRRVTKVRKGGKEMSFRAVVVVGDKNGTVGVGCQKAKEVQVAVQKAKDVAIRDASKIKVLGRAKTCCHKVTHQYGGAIVMLRPAGSGTGVLAGGAVKIVLELAGFENCYGKQIGSPNQLNNAMATLEGLKSMRTYEQVAKTRGMKVDELIAYRA